MKKVIAILILLFVFVTPTLSAASAGSFDNVLRRWTKDKKIVDRDDQLSSLTIFATYYSTEFIEAYVQQEAEKNLWTQQETEDYKYNFLKALRLDEMIPVQIKFINNGETMYLGPFDIMVSMKIGNKKYKPVDYDKRFNFKFQGEKEGLVYFPRYDEKTGKDLLKDIKTVSLTLKSTINPTITRGTDVTFLWDVFNDDPHKLYQGKTAARIETDRLLKRLEKLRKDKAEEEAKLAAINGEISTIQARLDELARL